MIFFLKSKPWVLKSVLPVRLHVQVLIFLTFINHRKNLSENTEDLQMLTYSSVSITP